MAHSVADLLSRQVTAWPRDWSLIDSNNETFPQSVFTNSYKVKKQFWKSNSAWDSIVSILSYSQSLSLIEWLTDSDARVSQEAVTSEVSEWPLAKSKVSDYSLSLRVWLWAWLREWHLWRSDHWVSGWLSESVSDWLSVTATDVSD